MKKIQYALLDPTGNRTILVESPVPVPEQPAVASKLMELEPSAEQVGFLTVNGEEVAMRMAGGEFCGNATMSAAALTAIDRGISDKSLSVSVSGTPEPVAVHVTALEDGRMRGTVNMPMPVGIKTETFPGGEVFPVVRFEGICHVIVESPLSREAAESLAPKWCRYLNADAVGIMLLDREAETLAPLVYVPAANTLCWENSCASGTTAVGAYLAAREGSVSVSLKQPGGSLHIETDAEGRLLLTGTVRLLHRRTAEIAE